MANDASTLLTLNPCETAQATLRLVEEVICALILDGVHFDFDYTFVRPEAKPIIRELVDHINADADRQVLVIGHTDRVGTGAYNQTLSESRATSVFAYITNQPAVWMNLLRTQLNSAGGSRIPRSGSGQSADRWQTREIQYMLAFMRNAAGNHFYNGPINNVFNADTQTALDAFRAENGLPVGGAPGPRIASVDEATWQKLFERYMALDALNVDLGRFLDPQLLGCGENFPRLETRAPGTQTQDRRDADARLEINRRVEFLLIPPSRVPSVLSCNAIYQDPASPVVVCPSSPQPISVTLHFTDAGTNLPKAGLTIQVTGQGGFQHEFVTDAQGRVLLPDGETVQGDYRVSVVGNFNLVLRSTDLGQVRGSEVLLHLTRSALVEMAVSAVPARLNFVENAAPFDQQLDQVSDPITSNTAVEFKLVADIDNVTGDTVTVDLASFLLRGPASGVVPGGGAGNNSGIINPSTPLEFVDTADVPAPNLALTQRFKLRLDSSEVSGDEVTVMLESRLVRVSS